MHGGTEWALPCNVLLSNSEVAVTMWVFKHSWFSTFTKDKGVRSSLKIKAWTLVHYFREHWTWCARQTPGARPSTCRNTDYALPLCCEHTKSHLYLHKIRHSQWSCPSQLILGPSIACKITLWVHFYCLCAGWEGKGSLQEMPLLSWRRHDHKRSEVVHYNTCENSTSVCSTHNTIILHYTTASAYQLNVNL